MKTSELTATALDWAVAKAEGKEDNCEVHAGNVLYGRVTSGFVHYNPSINWSLGGPIIAREEISIAKVGRSLDDAIAPHPECWCAHIDGAYAMYGSTPLIAAMRCYATSKLGNEVELPEELS